MTKRTIEMDVRVRQGRATIELPDDVPDGIVRLTITLPEAAPVAAATDPADNAAIQQSIRQWHQLGLSKQEMVKRLGGDPSVAWRLVNEFPGDRR